ncbi:hypothetical protein CFP56_031105 [Quercus suber]|uniref:Uncharacterized protein n=1 Tax=Quercus suber TaxID=58331 RepID=A0AAW0LTF6_QUESU
MVRVFSRSIDRDQSYISGWADINATIFEY